MYKKKLPIKSRKFFIEKLKIPQENRLQLAIYRKMYLFLAYKRDRLAFCDR